MKIIQVCPRFYPQIGGIETHVYEISKRLAKKHTVIVYTTDPTGKLPREETIQKIKIKRFKSLAPNESYFFSPQLYFALKRETCDILHIHSSQAFPSLLGYLAIKSNCEQLVFTPHYHPKGSTAFRNFLTKFFRPAQKMLLQNSDKVICMTNFEKQLLHKKFQIEKEKLIVIPHGIDTKKFIKLPKVRSNYDFEILFVGRLERYKRINWVLYVLRDLINYFPNKSIHFTIIGKGPYKSQLQKICSKLKIEDKVSFEHILSYKELLRRYASCHVFVMPSEYEAFGISILEALVCGKPVIVSNSGGLLELVKTNGYFVNSLNDLKEALISTIENPLKIKINIDEYSWSFLVKQILREVYEIE